jgi:malate dehydrogenase (oxaloacetate-decarboxylating)(NADP+)
MVLEGIPETESRGRIALFDVNGLLVSSRSDLENFQKPFALNHPPITDFVEAIETLRPTGIIGVTAVPGLFTQDVIRTMARINERPLIFPYSNPTSRSECTAEDAYRWSQGRVIFASGSPFPPVKFNGRTFTSGQGNNVYIFPALGMAIFATEATRVTEEMFIVAASAVAEQVTDENLAAGLIYPHRARFYRHHCMWRKRLRLISSSRGSHEYRDIGALVRARAYKPVYPEVA